MNWLALSLYVAGCFSTQMWVGAALHERGLSPNVPRLIIAVIAWPIAAPLAFIAALFK
jgi:hypothetical protein